MKLEFADDSPSPLTIKIMDPTRRFSDRAADYSAYRPGYPHSLLDLLNSGIHSTSQPITAVDIGAGTGISSAFLASAGWRVLAVEPNEQMRQQASLSPSPAVTFVAGTAESTSLPSGSADLVTAFQSFHWFNPQPALAEFHRLLRPGGRAALIWNIRDRADVFTRAYSDVIQQHADTSAGSDLQQREASGQHLLSSGLFTDGRRVSLPSSQPMDLEALLGRTRSASYLPNSGPAYDELARDLHALFQRFSANGEVQMIYQTIAFLAERRDE
jgi:SAM-dependent methyltransferase